LKLSKSCPSSTRTNTNRSKRLHKQLKALNISGIGIVQQHSYTAFYVLLPPNKMLVSYGSRNSQRWHCSKKHCLLRLLDNSEKKMPVFVFIQDSQPIPFVLNYGNNLTATFLNIIDKYALSKYHVFEITMPDTPLYCDSTFFTRVHSVIDYITEQQWVDRNNIIVFGHSQGAYIAAALAARDKRISAVGLATLRCRLARTERSASRADAWLRAPRFMSPLLLPRVITSCCGRTALPTTRVLLSLARRM